MTEEIQGRFENTTIAQTGKITSVGSDGSQCADYLYRISLKSLIDNEAGQILVVKEIDRMYWDLPGGGMDFGETTETSLARELYEEVGYEGGLRYQVFDTSEQVFLEHIGVNMILIFCRVWPENFDFTPGEDGDKVAFVDPETLKNTGYHQTDRIYAAHMKWQEIN